MEEENCPECGDPFPLETLVYHAEKCRTSMSRREAQNDPDLVLALKLQKEEEDKKYVKTI
jgi:hypothetical protein